MELMGIGIDMLSILITFVILVGVLLGKRNAMNEYFPILLLMNALVLLADMGTLVFANDSKTLVLLRISVILQGSLTFISISGFISINIFVLLEKKFNILGLLGILFLFTCLGIYLYAIWTNKTLDRNILIISISAFLFAYIVTTIMRLKKRLLFLQIITYISMVAYDMLFALSLYKPSDIISKAHLISLVVVAIFIFIVAIIYKKIRVEVPVDNRFVKVPVEDYNNLNKRIEELEYLQNHSTYSNTDISSDDSWVCDECGTKNETNYCGYCGAKRPEKKWICECGSENEAIYCPNCGKRKPE